MQTSVDEKLKRLIAIRLGKNEVEIQIQSSLASASSMSVIKFARLMKEVGDEYHIVVPKDETRKIETVGDLQATVAKYRK